MRREACCSVLTFLTRLFEPKLLLACSPEVATHVRSSPSLWLFGIAWSPAAVCDNGCCCCARQITAAVVPRAPKMLRLLLAGAAGALPAPRGRDITDVLAAMLQVTALLCLIYLHPRSLSAASCDVLHMQAMPEQVLQWLEAAVNLIPEEAATAADRAQLLAAARAAAQRSVGSSRWL
jgi:hypothetical protein